MLQYYINITQGYEEKTGLVHRIGGCICMSFLMLAFGTNHMSAVIALIANQPSTKVTGIHDAWSSAHHT
jgi:hypothetical protein